MGSPAAIGVDDDLSPSQTGIAVRASDDEATLKNMNGRRADLVYCMYVCMYRGVQVVDGFVVQVLRGHHGLDHMLQKLFLYSS